MNERIKELAEQAISEVDYIRDDEFTNMELQKMYIPDCFSEKFAELIVRECIEICDQHPSKIFKKEWDADVVAWDITQRIKGRFGVEE